MDMVELKNHARSFDRAVVWDDMKAGPESQEIKNWRVIWNVDKHKAATCVSDRYNALQHVDFTHAVADSIMNLKLKADARVRDGGNRVFIDINFPDAKVELKKVGEEFLCGCRIINSYDKSSGIIVAPRYERLSCSNGMVSHKVIVSGFNIRHSKKLTEDFERTIQMLIKKMVNSSEKLKSVVNNCMKDSIEFRYLKEILSSKLAKKHADKIREILKDEIGRKKPTRWDLYNAFTKYATHDGQISPLIENQLQRKAENILITPLKAMVPLKVKS